MLSQIRTRVFRNSVSDGFGAVAFLIIAVILIYQIITLGPMVFNRSNHIFSTNQDSVQPFSVKFGNGTLDYATFALSFWKTHGSPIDLNKNGSPFSFKVLFQWGNKEYFVPMRPCKSSDFPYDDDLSNNPSDNRIKFSFCIDNKRYPKDRECPDFINDSDCRDHGFTLTGNGASKNHSAITIIVTKCNNRTSSSEGITCLNQTELDKFWEDYPFPQVRLYFTSHLVQLANYTFPSKPRGNQLVLDIDPDRHLDTYVYYDKVVIDDYDSLFLQGNHQNQTSYSVDSTKTENMYSKLKKGKYPAFVTIVLQSSPDTITYTRKYPFKYPDLFTSLSALFTPLITISICLYNRCFKREVEVRNDENPPNLENPIETNNAPVANVEGRQTVVPLLSGQEATIN